MRYLFLAIIVGYLMGVVVYYTKTKLPWVTPVAAQANGWKPYTVYVPPNRNTASFRVDFKPVEQVRVLCNGAVGCMKAVMDDKGNFVGTPLIIAPNPDSFNDQFALIILGHEILHVLGAYHD